MYVVQAIIEWCSKCNVVCDGNESAEESVPCRVAIYFLLMIPLILMLSVRSSVYSSATLMVDVLQAPTTVFVLSNKCVVYMQPSNI